MQGRHIVKQDSDLMHQRNMKMIYKLIKSERVTTKAKLTRITKLSPTSIGRIVGELIENQFVQEVGQESNGVGRKATSLSLNPNRVLAIGVSVDRGLIQAGIVNVEGELCASIERPIDHSISQEMLIRKTVELIEDLIGRYDGKLKQALVGIGISVPGPVAWPEGIMQYSPQFRWGNCNFREELQKQLKRSVLVENNVKSMAIAEHLFGDMKEYTDFIVFNVGSGVGAAVISKGRLCRGASNFAGEIGHTIIDPNGPLCDCGRHGCFQTYVSMNSVQEHFGMPFSEVIAKGNADKEVQEYLEQVTDRFAIMTANLVNYYDTKCVLFHGQMQQEWPEMVNIIKEKADKLRWKSLSKEFEVLGADIKSEMVASASVILSEFLEADNLEAVEIPRKEI